MPQKMKKFFVLILIIGLCIITTDLGYGAGDNCKRVKIKIKNTLDREVKVVELYYFDPDKNKCRQELTWLPLRILPGVMRMRIRNLEHVLNDQTRIWVRVRRHLGGYSWGLYYWQKSAAFVCTNDCVVWVLIGYTPPKLRSSIPCRE